MYFKGFDLTNLDNKDIYNLVLERKIPTFPPGYWCSVSKEEGKKVAIELLKYLIDDRLKLTREEVLDKVTKGFILDNKLWTACKLYFGRSAIKYIIEAYPSEYRAFEFANSKVPQGYWCKRENRIDAIKWLIDEKLKWNIQDIKDNFNRDLLSDYGLGTLTNYYNASCDVINEIYSEEINCWELKKSSVPANFWKSKDNRVRAIRWMIEEKLKFTKKQIIYELSMAHFAECKLTTLVCDYYNKSIRRAIVEAYENEIMPWEYAYHRWSENDTREATRWLINKLDIEQGKSSMDVDYSDFKKNKLRYVIDKYYFSSPRKAMLDITK